MKNAKYEKTVTCEQSSIEEDVTCGVKNAPAMLLESGLASH